MDFDFDHTFSDEEARERLAALGDYLRNRHGIAVAWEGDRATFDGKYLVINIQGSMTLSRQHLRFSGKDPGLLWRKKATNYLRGKLEKYFDPGTPLDELPRG